MPRLSAVLTTYNNARTLRRCLRSLGSGGARVVDEILLLDSGSEDNSLAIAAEYGARIETRPFSGYGEQKQAAVELADNDWVLLLDADEWLSAELHEEILNWRMTEPDAAAYTLPRREWLLWRWQHPWTKPVRVLRLFDRRRARINDVPVHAAVETRGECQNLRGDLLHSGEAELHTKVDKINRYSSGQAQWRRQRCCPRLRMLFYPLLAFWREYLWRRQFLNGWAGFIAARTAAFYAFLKYAKAYEKGKRLSPPQE